MKKYLSVDCGGTKTAFLLCNEYGEQLAFCIKGPGNYLVNGIVEVMEVLKAGLREISRQADISAEDITSCFLAIAGFKDIPQDIPRITRLIEKELFPLPVVLGNDTENALAGSLLGKSGIHVIAGTGSIGLGYDENQRYIRSGGWHHLFGGDEGSAYWIGCQLILHFTRQADGREKRSEIYTYLMEKYSLGCAENILELVVHQWSGKRDKIASLAADVYELAERGDDNAVSIFKSAGKEHGDIIRSIYARGNFGNQVTISYSGGVFKAMVYLRESIEEGIKTIPHIFAEPQMSPVGGGILLAMKAAGHKSDEVIVENLRMCCSLQRRKCGQERNV